MFTTKSYLRCCSVDPQFIFVSCYIFVFSSGQTEVYAWKIIFTHGSISLASTLYLELSNILWHHILIFGGLIFLDHLMLQNVFSKYLYSDIRLIRLMQYQCCVCIAEKRKILYTGNTKIKQVSTLWVDFGFFMNTKCLYWHVNSCIVL